MCMLRREMPLRLAEGSGSVVDEAGKGISWLGDELKKIGDRSEPNEK